MREHIELRGTPQALLADLSTYPTGLTRAGRSVWARLKIFLSTLLVLAWGAVACAGISALLLLCVRGDHPGVRPIWWLMPAWLLLVSVWAVGAAWWRVCRRRRDPRLVRRLEMAFGLLAHLVPFGAQQEQGIASFSSSAAARPHGAVSLLVPLDGSAQVLVSLGEVGGLWSVFMEVRGAKLPRDLGDLPWLGQVRPVFCARTPHRLVLRLSGAPLPLDADDGLSCADLGRWMGHVLHSLRLCPGDAPSTGLKGLSRPRPESVPVHLLDGGAQPYDIPDERGACLSPSHAQRIRVAVPSPWSGRFPRRVAAWVLSLVALVLGVPVLDVLAPGVLEGFGGPVLVGFAALALGVPACVGWWWEPTRRVRAHQVDSPTMSWSRGELSMASFVPRVHVDHIDLTAPFAVHLTRARSGRAPVLGVRLTQTRGARMESLCFEVPVVSGPVLRRLPRLERHHAMLSGEDFASWVWPVIRHHAMAHGLTLPAAHSLYES